MEPIYILLTTYQRTQCALETIRALKERLVWPNIGWAVNDDGSDPGHVEQIINEIGTSYTILYYNSHRRGVGHGMNHTLRMIFDRAQLVLVMEDDWRLNRALDLTPYANLLMNHENFGMVRFGYLSPNLLGYLVPEEGKLLWRLEPNAETYRFTGHPSLRHARFHQQYGYYDEGLAPGMTELSMCGKVNLKSDGPHIVYPAECGAYGFFDHIGSESLADMNPGERHDIGNGSGRAAG